MKDVGKMKSEKEIKEKIRECKETIHICPQMGLR